MKKFLLLLLLLLAATFVLRDQLWPGVHPTGELAPAAREADLATGNLTAAAATPTPTGAIDPTRTERRATAGSLRVRALAQAKDGTTAPLPDLLVLAFEGEGSHEPVDGFVHRLRTDERGEAVFASLQPGTFSVRAPSARVATQHAVVADSGEALAELRIDSAYTVHGIVIDANGRRVEGADLWFARNILRDAYGIEEPSEVFARRAGRSAPDGSFAVAVTDPRERRISASHTVHGESMARYVQSGQRELVLALQPATAKLSGVVRDARETPVVDAVVVVRIGNENARRLRDGTLVAGHRPFGARTDADGQFAFAELPAGRATATASADPHGAVTVELDLRAGEPQDVALNLPEGVIVHGFVRRANGTPLRATVRLLPSRGVDGSLNECTVRPDGSYLLRARSRHPFVIAVALGHRTLVDREFERPEPGSLRCDFVVDDAFATAGTVTSSDGHPLAEWRVRLLPRGGSPVETRTDESGAFLLESRFAELAEASVFAPGSGTPALVQDGVRPGETLLLKVPLAAMPRGRIEGRVTDAAGSPAAVTLRLRCPSPRVQHETQSGADGSFAFEGLVALRWTLEHAHFGNTTILKDAIEIADGEVRDLGTIALPPTGRLAIEVLDEFGRPWSGSAVGFSLHDQRGAGVAVDHVTIDGRLGVEAAPGNYTLGVIATDLLCDRVPVTIEAGRMENARLSLRVGRTLRLHFTSDAENGRGEARPLRVAIRDANGASVLDESLPRARALSGNRAFWQLSRTFPFGPHRIEATTEDGLRFAMDLDVTESFDSDPIVEVPIVR